MTRTKHPKGLMMLFFTEMWERFSFYGMRALLTLYMISQLFEHLQDPEKKSKAIGIYAAYGALVYTTPFIGGILADKYLGHQKSVLFGALMMAIGHFVMAIESEFWLYVALAFLIIGNGFFKPNISTMVGGLYKENDSRRDGGFTIFYMGVNLGAFLAPLVCGAIGEGYGWHYGFGIAGIGMLIGLFIFGKWKAILKGNGHVPNLKRLKDPVFMFFNREHLIYIASFASVAVFTLLINYYEIMTYVLTPFALLVIISMIIVAFRCEKVERQRLFVILILLFFTTLFWAFFEQAGSSITLFTNENVNRNIFDISLPASMFVSVNPLFIILLGPVFSWFWIRLANRKREPSTPFKFGLGLLQLGLGFLIFALGTYFVSVKELTILNGGQELLIEAAVIPLAFLVIGYLLHTTGELCLSPIGLSMITKLAPKKMIAMIMGAWFLSSAMAHLLGGGIAKLTAEKDDIDVNQTIAYEYIDLAGTNKTFTGKDSIKIKKILSPAVESGITVLYDAGTKILPTNAEQELKETALEPASQACIDTVKKYQLIPQLNKLGVKTDNFEQNIQLSYEKGIATIVQNSKKASQTAIEQEYIVAGKENEIAITTLLSFGGLFGYLTVFKSIGWIAIIASVLLFALVPFMKKMMHGVH